jgi:hypothetical protein
MGTGHQDCQHRRVHHRLPPIVRAKQKVYAYRRWLCEEIIRNKFFCNYNHSCFILIVSFELELTSYIQCIEYTLHYTVTSLRNTLHIVTDINGGTFIICHRFISNFRQCPPPGCLCLV